MKEVTLLWGEKPQVGQTGQVQGCSRTGAILLDALFYGSTV